MAVTLAVVGLASFVVAQAFADAGNPILGTIHGAVVPDDPSNPNDGVTV